MKTITNIALGAVILISCAACDPVNDDNRWFYDKCMKKELSVNKDFVYSAMIEGALEGGMSLEDFCKCMTGEVKFYKNDKGGWSAKGVKEAAETCFIEA